MKKNRKWESIPLGKICLIRTGKKDANEGNPMGEFPFFTCSKINTFSDTYSFDTEAILIAGNGEVGNLHKYKGKFEAYQRTYVLDGFSLNINYIYQYVSAFLKNELKKSYIGSTIPFIKLSDLKNFLICYPVLTDEQAKIAEILETLDLAIEQTETIITKQQRIRTGLLQDLLTKGIDKQGNIRTEETHEFKDSPLGRIPVEWNTTTIDNIAEFVTSGSRGWAKYYSAEGDLFLRIGNLTREHINLKLDDVMYVQPIDTSEGKRTAIRTGDILISITADLGIIGVVPESIGIGYVNQHIALVRPLEKKVNPRFIGWFLSCNRGQNQFDAGNESGAKAGLNLTAVRNLRIPVVDIEEQNKIAMVLDQSAQVIDNYIKDLNKLKHLKTALMQDLLTGKKRVTSLLKEMR